MSSDIEGLIIFLALLLVLVAWLPNEDAQAYNAAIEQCEKELPRNQRCKITAIPVGED